MEWSLRAIRLLELAGDGFFPSALSDERSVLACAAGKAHMKDFAVGANPGCGLDLNCSPRELNDGAGCALEERLGRIVVVGLINHFLGAMNSAPRQLVVVFSLPFPCRGGPQVLDKAIEVRPTSAAAFGIGALFARLGRGERGRGPRFGRD